MTLEELRTSEPELYKNVKALGAAEERERARAIFKQARTLVSNHGVAGGIEAVVMTGSMAAKAIVNGLTLAQIVEGEKR